MTAPSKLARALTPISLPLLLGFALLAVAWLIPGHYLPWMMFQQEACAAAAVLVVGLAVLQSRSAVRWPIPALAMAALAVVPLLQLAFGLIVFRTDGVVSAAYLLALSLAISVGATLAAGRLRTQFLEGLCGAIVAAAIVSTGIALYQWLRLPPLGDWIDQVGPGSRPFANFSQPNHLASLLGLGLLCVVRWYETRRIGAWGCACATLWFLWGIALTQSRTGWLLVAMVAGGCLALRLQSPPRTPAWATLAAVAMFVMMVLGQGPLLGLWEQESGGGTAVAAVRTEAGTRTTHWQVLAAAALDSPWVGYGWNQIAPAQFDAALAFPASGENLMHSHNLILDLVLYNGIPLAVALIAAIALWFRRTVRRCRDASSWCLLGMVAALLVHAMLEYPLHYAYFLLPVGLLVGALDSADEHPPPAPLIAAAAPSRLRLGALAAALVAAAAALAWIGIEYMRAEEALRRLRFATARIALTVQDLRSPEVFLLDGWKAYHDAALIRPRPGMPAAERALLHDVARRYPYAPALERHALALALHQRAEEASLVLARICKMYPEPIQDIVSESWAQAKAAHDAHALPAFPDCRAWRDRRYRAP